MPEQLTGAEALIRSLEYEGVEVVFGMPGGAILKAYDPLLDSPIRHVLARHEQGAGHMASGYAHATGRVGVAVGASRLIQTWAWLLAIRNASRSPSPARSPSRAARSARGPDPSPPIRSPRRRS